jgi:hypothetical protein
VSSVSTPILNHKSDPGGTAKFHPVPDKNETRINSPPPK